MCQQIIPIKTQSSVAYSLLACAQQDGNLPLVISSSLPCQRCCHLTKQLAHSDADGELTQILAVLASPGYLINHTYLLFPNTRQGPVLGALLPLSEAR